ncbi:DUF58 domain-containing protein [Haloarchaeobius sp. TZWWS8]|uniref:DUF58 domain-containing protein n=1 Tax=Haloarchaeobius sp. TZWWS8 TaxID=3446121 RepID=UPI003EBD8289
MSFQGQEAGERERTGAGDSGGNGARVTQDDAAGTASESRDERPPATAQTQRVISERTDETNHWRGVAAVTLVAGAVGIVTRQPGLLLSAVVGVGYLAYARIAEVPPVTLRITRELSDATPSLGDEVAVTVRVTNEGSRILPDVRLVDGVPDELAVEDGSARLGTALRPGETDSFRYTLTAKRGTHEFKTCEAIVRGWAGARETHTRFRTNTEMVCTPSLEATIPVPLRKQTSRYAGRVDTDIGGDGVEFHSTREYRRGDPLTRVDWKRYARSGELATLLFREERAATVMCLLDLRREAYVRRDEDGLHAADLGIDAAGRVFSALLETGDRVGITALTPGTVWLAPGLGNEHRAKVEELFAHHPALSSERPQGFYSVTLGVRGLRKRLPGDAQVVFFSPLTDDEAAHAARLVHAHGHKVTIVSPDATNDETLGQRIARAERRARITSLRQGGIRVVDWNPDEPLANALARGTRRWG